MKCKICKEREGNKKEMCSIYYSREYRKNNKDKIRLVVHKKNLRTKKERAEYSKKWQKENHERYRASIRKRRKQFPEKERLRKKTISLFKDLRDNGECELCNSKLKVEFHHPEPYKYDVFQILCRKCHLKLHRDIYEESLKKPYLSSS